METKVIERNQTPLFEMTLIKSHLRINSHDDDSLLKYLLSVATDWVENELGKSLLLQKRKVSHRNNCFCLPYGPVIDVLEVYQHKTKMEKEDYTLTPKRDSVIIQVPFFWKSPTLHVTYTAGFGEKPEDVPTVLRHAVLGTLEYLYDHGGDIHSLEDSSMPWLRTHRTYRLGV